MRDLLNIFEEDDSVDASSQQLFALAKFLLGRANNTASKKQISVDAFIELAKHRGTTVVKDQLAELISKEPLSNILEPFEPNSGVIRFKGNNEKTNDMSPDQAKNTVNKNAKAAMKRGMK